MKETTIKGRVRRAASAAIAMLLGWIFAAGIAVAADPPGGEDELAEILVTAQKRAENVQNVPIAMQAYTGEQLQKTGVGRIVDIVQLAPNLNVVVQNSLSQ